MNEEDDAVLVSETLDGNQKAFASLVDKYYKTVYNSAIRMGIGSDDAFDVTQAVFVKAYENLRSYKSRYKFFSWLYRIAVNESLNVIHRRKYLEPLDDDEPATTNSPDGEYETTENVEMVQQCLMRLKLDYRVVIVLNHFQQLTYNEISFILDIPEKTVKSRLYTARQHLRDILIQEKGAL